jgi:uncharacterized protein
VQVGPDLHVVPDPPIVYLNHSCAPSCGLLIDRGAGVMEVRALRRVEPGEELAVDYATFEYVIAGYDGPCLCGAAACRGQVTGYKGLPPGLRAAYGPYVAEHLRETDALAQAAVTRWR